MTPDPRIADLARGILQRTLTAEDVPVYDRVAVQALLVVWWLERSVLHQRLPGTTPR